MNFFLIKSYEFQMRFFRNSIEILQKSFKTFEISIKMLRITSETGVVKLITK